MENVLSLQVVMPYMQTPHPCTPHCTVHSASAEPAAMARVVLAPQELPVGVLTAVLGGGYLLWRVYRDADKGARS